MEGATVIVEETGVDAERGTSRLTQDVTAHGHALLADEPLDDGGADLGPPPFGFILSGLGACTAMTLRMYADLKEWPLERVRVELRHEQGPDGLIIHRDLTLIGDLDDAQRARLEQIAGKCPVHKALTGPIDIRTTLV